MIRSMGFFGWTGIQQILQKMYTSQILPTAVQAVMDIVLMVLLKGLMPDSWTLDMMKTPMSTTVNLTINSMAMRIARISDCRVSRELCFLWVRLAPTSLR